MKNQKGTTLVFVTNQLRCVRLITLGAKIARQSKTKLTVLHIADSKWPDDPAGLQYLFDQTAAQGGEMQVLFATRPLKEMENAIRSVAPLHVVTGTPAEKDSVVYRLQETFPDCIFYSVSPEEEADAVSAGAL